MRKTHFVVCRHLRLSKQLGRGYLEPVSLATCKTCLRFAIKACANKETVEIAKDRLSYIRINESVVRARKKFGVKTFGEL